MGTYERGTPEYDEMMFRADLVKVVVDARAYGKDRPHHLERLRAMGFPTEAAADSYLRKPLRKTLGRRPQAGSR